MPAGGAKLPAPPASASTCRNTSKKFCRLDATVAKVVGEIERGHATLAEPALDMVPALEGGIQAGDCIVRLRGHTGSQDAPM
jgi:hypothetical protein